MMIIYTFQNVSFMSTVVSSSCLSLDSIRNRPATEI